MPTYVYSDCAVTFTLDSVQTANEGRTVSTAQVMNSGNSFSILLASGTTAGLTLWANNSNPSLDDRRYPDTAHLQVGSNMSVTGIGYISNPSFTSNWVNITSTPAVNVSASGFFGGDCSFRYLRLQGTGLSGGMTAYMWTTDNVVR